MGIGPENRGRIEVAEDLVLYTLHRFAVYAAGKRIPFKKSALEKTLSASGIDSFGALIDLDESARNRIGTRVLENLDLVAPEPQPERSSSPCRSRQSER